jgi:sugar phosphate isomerase/epimerase
MQQKSPPLIGTALMIDDLPRFRDWISQTGRDLEIQDACMGAFLDGDWESGARRAVDLLEGFTGRISVHGPYSGLPLVAYDTRVREVVALRIRQALDFAAAVGATQMVLHSPFDFFGHPMVAHTPAHGLSYEIEQVHFILDGLLPQAKTAGVTLVLETCYDRSSAPLLALVRSFESDFVRLSLDVGHAFTMQQIGGPPPDQWVREAGSLLAHVHLQDTDGLVDRHWAPGEGNVNWYAFFEALSELEAPPRLLLEIMPEKIIASVEYFRGRGFGS